MSDDHRKHDFDLLEPPLQAAVEAVLAEPLSEDAARRVVERARRLAVVTLPPAQTLAAPRRSWNVSRSRVGAVAAAAALAAVACGIVVLMDRSGSRAFAQVIERIRAASTVQFSTSFRFGQRPAQKGRMFIEGQRLRFENFEGALVSVTDFDRRQAIHIDMHRKEVRATDVLGDALHWLVNPIDQLRRAKSDDAELIGEERLDGRLTRAYRLDKVDLLGMKGDAETMVWIDVESELPAQIVIRDADPKHPTEFRFADFVWNEPLDAELFSLEVPAGFTRLDSEEVAVAPEAKHAGGEESDATATPAIVDGVLNDRVPARILWDPQGGTITALMRDPESTPASGRRQNALRQWDAATGQMRWSQAVLGAGDVARSTDGMMLATVIGYEVQLRDAASGEITRTWTTDESLSPLAFSPDGKTLAAGIAEWGPYGGRGGEMSGGVQFWNVEQESVAGTIPDDKPTTFLRYSPDGEVLATSSNDGPVKLWSVATGKLLRLLPGRRADFSPDGQTIACVSVESTADKTIGRVDLYRVADGVLLRTLSNEPSAAASYLLCVAFSPDGRLLAATDWNGTVTLWDVATGDRQRLNAAHKAGVLTAAFSPDGAKLATGSEEQTLRLWKVPAASGQSAEGVR